MFIEVDTSRPPRTIAEKKMYRTFEKTLSYVEIELCILMLSGAIVLLCLIH